MYIAQYTNSRTKNINRPSTFELSNDEENIISLQVFINLSAKEQVFHEHSEFALVTWLQHQASMLSHTILIVQSYTVLPRFTRLGLASQ